MEPKKKVRTIKEVGTPSQAPKRAPQTCLTPTNARNQDNFPNPLGLTNSDHIATYNVLSSKLVVATCYYDEDLLIQLGLLDCIH